MVLPIVKLLTKPGCCACDNALFILRRLKEHTPFEGKVVNILKHEEYLIHKDDLPVILVNETVVCKQRVIESNLRNELLKYNQN
jgi:hypothetical protein